MQEPVGDPTAPKDENIFFIHLPLIYGRILFKQMKVSVKSFISGTLGGFAGGPVRGTLLADDFIVYPWAADEVLVCD